MPNLSAFIFCSLETRTNSNFRYGSIVSNIGAALVGGPGIVPGANIGSEFALFEPGCRHVAMDIAGQDVAKLVFHLFSFESILARFSVEIRHCDADDSGC